MLTILTGAPGAGKTCAMVSLLSELGSGRALYVDGVNGLTVPHVPLDARKWHEEVPDGAAIAVDEGQRLWRPRGPGQRVPEDIQAMETHRHRGLDFFITTQHPKLLDGNIKNLCGRHVHIRDLGLLGRWWYEWPEAADPGSWRTAPIKKKYKLDKKAFGLYKSASMHVKPIRSVPWMMVLLAAALLGVGFLAWRVTSIIGERIKGSPAFGGAAPTAQSAASAPRAVSGPGMGNSAAGVLPAYLLDRKQFHPRFTGQPETAPAYDEIRRVTVFPQVVGGWCRGNECRCIDQQGRDARLSWSDCQAWITNPPFNPYLVRARDGESSSAAAKLPPS